MPVGMIQSTLSSCPAMNARISKGSALANVNSTLHKELGGFQAEIGDNNLASPLLPHYCISSVKETI